MLTGVVSPRVASCSYASILLFYALVLSSSCYIITTAAACEAVDPAAASVYQWHWSVLAWSETWMCLPVVFRQHALSSDPFAATDDARDVKLMLVHAVYSDNVESMAWNMVESMLHAFATERKWAAAAADDGIHATTGRTTTPRSTEWCHRHPLENVTAGVHDIDGLCFAFAGLDDHQGNTAASSTWTTAASEVSAPFASKAYYARLSQKLQYFQQRVHHAHYQHHQQLLRDAETNGQVKVGIRVEPWLLLMDVDVEVFPGFFAMLQHKMECPYLKVHCQHANYRPSCCPGDDRHDGDDDHPFRIDAYFQRESRKRINSGLMFIRHDSSSSNNLFREAVAQWRPHLYGDQTALQLVVKRQVQLAGPCSNDKEGAAASPSTVSQQKQQQQQLLRHHVFHRLRVNGNVLNASLLVALHAHMSGASGKKAALRNAIQDMQRAGRLPHRGTFLTKTAAFLRRHRRQSDMCEGGRLVTTSSPPNAEGIVDSSQSDDAHQQHCLAEHVCRIMRHATVGLLTTHGPAVTTSAVASNAAAKRQLFQLPPPITTKAAHTDSAQPAITPLASAPLGSAVVTQPTAPPAPSNANNITANVTTSLSSRRPKRLKAKAVWTALPALLVIITLTVYHYYISGGGDVSSASTAAIGQANVVDVPPAAGAAVTVDMRKNVKVFKHHRYLSAASSAEDMNHNDLGDDDSTTCVDVSEAPRVARE